MSLVNSIEIESLSKSYRLGPRQESIQLREQLVNLLKGPFAKREPAEMVWALRDISFRVPEGEVVGIIGRNGAGKSTLLKILSRITHPTTGSIKVRGRVASLLEVGTGFHEELTGRENVYLNGSILGMRRRDIDRRFDEIVAFSEIETFIDTPIKRYSSGMRLRLGFAVAAHLDPDVLIVDEVLAVGDAGFQKKCITKMEGLRSGGRTVLFVSHNMAAVENLCSRGIWIDGGRLRLDGGARDVIKAYLSSYATEETAGRELRVEGRVGSGEILVTNVEFLSPQGGPAPLIQCGDGLVLRMHYRADRLVRSPSFGVRLFTSMGTLITDTSTWHHGLSIPSVGPGEGYVDLEIEHLNLMPDRYTASFWVTCGSDGKVCDGDVRAPLDVEQADVYGSRGLDSKFGIVYFPQRWHVPGLEDATEERAVPNARVVSG